MTARKTDEGLPSPAIQVKPASIALVVLGLLFVIVGVVYFTKTATDLPSVMPGHQSGSTKHHTKHGIAMLGLAVVVWIGAWFTPAPSPSRS